MKSPPVISFHTDDLGLAAFLRCQGHPLQKLKPSNGDGSHYEFVFDIGGDEGDDLAGQYYNRVGTVAPRSYYEELGILKRLLAQFRQRAA